MLLGRRQRLLPEHGRSDRLGPEEPLRAPARKQPSRRRGHGFTHTGAHVGIIVGMWVSGFLIALWMPRLGVVGSLGSLGVIGAVACACFGGGGACMAVLCMNDKIREAEQNGGSWFKAGGGPLAPDGWIGRHFVEPEIDAGDPPVVEAPAGADDVEAPSEP